MSLPGQSESAIRPGGNVYAGQWAEVTELGFPASVSSACGLNFCFSKVGTWLKPPDIPRRKHPTTISYFAALHQLKSNSLCTPALLHNYDILPFLDTK